MRSSALRIVVSTRFEPSRHGHSHAASMCEWPMMCSTRLFAAAPRTPCEVAANWPSTRGPAAAPSTDAPDNRNSRRESSSLWFVDMKSLKARGAGA
jgi:hypothetical protein